MIPTPWDDTLASLREILLSKSDPNDAYELVRYYGKVSDQIEAYRLGWRDALKQKGDA